MTEPRDRPAPGAAPAAAEWYRDLPRSIRPHAILGLSLLAFSFAGFGVRAFRAPPAAAMLAQGSLASTGPNPIVRHLKGAMIQKILAVEGGVIATGRAIAEILPAKVPLTIEAPVARSDIGSVQVGQTGTVRLTTLNQRTTPVLAGAVAYVSPEVVAGGQDRRQRDVCIFRVALEPEASARLHGFTPLPGMPAEVMTRTTERSFAQSVAKPIVVSMSPAFREK
jgi:multidrug efflux pump subunit AcrA (membrane-fusion protein)